MRTAFRSSGFTLVEVMVAITILSLVLLGTITGLRTLAGTQTALESKTQQVEEIRAVGSFLRDLMDSAVVGDSSGGLTLGGGAEEAYFKFSQDFAEWKASVLFGENFGGSHIVRVGRENDSLVLRWVDARGVRPDQIAWSESPVRVLVSQIQSFNVTVMYEWDGVWESNQRRGRPPALTRLQIQAAGRYWPEVVLRVPR